MDESTDRLSEKHVVFVVRYLDGDAVRTSFLQIERGGRRQGKDHVRLPHICVCQSQHSDKEGMCVLNKIFCMCV